MGIAGSQPTTAPKQYNPTDWTDPKGYNFDWTSMSVTPKGYPGANPMSWPGWLQEQAARPGMMIAGGYDAGQKFLTPYEQGGVPSYNALQQMQFMPGYQSNQNYGAYGNPMDARWKSANMSPQDYYAQMMKGYETSAEAKHEEKEAMRGYNNAASASGMLGSGDHFNFAQENAADIAARDRQRYFDNMMKTDTQQQGYAQNFQGQQQQNQENQYQDLMRRQQIMEMLAKMGYDTSQQSSQNAISEGKDLAKEESGVMGGIGKGVGAIIGGLFGKK